MKYSQGLRIARKMGIKVDECLAPDHHAHGLCVYWDNKVELKGDLPETKKLHVLIHELAHATGSKERLNRMTLLEYDACEVYALVEEAIAEASAVTILSALNVDCDKKPIDSLIAMCDNEGIEWEVDILPEVERVVRHLQQYFSEVLNETNRR